MKESKKTQVPLPGSKAKSKARDAPAKYSKSQELVGSDDDSSAENTPQPKAAAKPKTTIGIHKANGVAKSKPQSNGKEKATSKSTSKSKPSPKKPAPKQIVTQEQVADLSSSEISDDSDAPARDITTKLPGNGTGKDVASESESSESDSDSSSDESDDNTTAPAPQPVRPSQTQSQSHAVDFRPAQAFVPPKGFVPVTIDERTKSKATSIFDNLEGKQIWHITAPAGVSLKDLNELAMDKALNGKAIHSYKGTDYGFSKINDTENGAREVLVPRQKGYKTVSAKISQTLHLQQVVRLPELSSKQADVNTGSEAAASITRSTIRTPRPQVKGLKMRFRPTGFGGTDAGTLGDSDSDDEQLRAPAGLGMPNGLNLPSRSAPSRAEKRKHGDAHGEEGIESASKKVKKQRSPEEIKRKEEKRAKKEKKRAQEAAKS
ncbi:hypothetical protein P153DRAFT_422708 [Dothidotthia symphoricarpi CBS 119687]|uniref:Uncharacterized protein n=1 Tax=Dothidotthia symphoricarpi CBS 119687 TaxID=1392245 RepID=A0A6A6ADP3_9PLEO|nr:uncharacterized protein P153DRAFT_422708 [Dothidotthia symphoricarpi CBS 119687]KAF2129959.1 hypothetical protein P153DRAFT_422708 [Dothidotthia symphoricarpi CBS 119687]